ncbi:MAG TPA: hypothetical protein VGC24_09575, partial [Burkholderiaceae bacterium]
MEFLVLAAVLAASAYILKNRDQQRHIALLGQVLGQYRVEKLMEGLLEGYLRWLGEADLARRQQVWAMLDDTARTLAAQFNRFAADFARTPAPLAQVSKLPIAIPLAQQLLPGTRLFDARQVFAIHARGIEAVAANLDQLAPKEQAFMMTAELLLMQHSCHWYCRSRTVASARML